MPSGTADRAGSAGRWLLSRLRTRWVWSPCQESLSHPDPSGTGGEGRMPAVDGVGEPCAGEPHARFEVAGVGDGVYVADSPEGRDNIGLRIPQLAGIATQVGLLSTDPAQPVTGYG